MGIFGELIFSLPLGFVYSVFVYKLAQVMFGVSGSVAVQQRILLFLWIVGVAGIILTKVVTLNSKYIRGGLIIGSIILIAFPILTGWGILRDDIKLLIVGVALGSLLYYYHEPKKI
ncbi:MAG: hypothetical protein Hyperionvirus17_26 [Hyperionvirus sp.]|uniref:Uncharacterized protein n=1 Tax=Hyperionvirus sp. TaxID=2487770 RepID=A0A3G5AA14_9VIRU|nr:MAG: hypothetical protein Hyperionvirus17_26 [Hyperionvirus sp.]